MQNLYYRARNRTRLVVIARKSAHARAVVRAIGMPVQRVRPAPADAIATWEHWLWGFPPPLLWVDAALQPEQVTGADLVLLVEPARRRGDPLTVRAVGRPLNRLFTFLRAAADADMWQQRTPRSKAPASKSS
jgi:hypothetical protein